MPKPQKCFACSGSGIVTQEYEEIRKASEKIRLRRIDTGLHLGVLARIVEMSVSELSGAEHGRESLAVIKIISDALDNLDKMPDGARILDHTGRLEGLGTCDWGGCDRPSSCLRLSQKSWLACCVTCSHKPYHIDPKRNSAAIVRALYE